MAIQPNNETCKNMSGFSYSAINVNPRVLVIMKKEAYFGNSVAINLCASSGGGGKSSESPGCTISR